VCYVLYSDNFRGEAVKTILLALILGVCLQAVAQQQEWGADNCLWTSAGNGWQQTNACRNLEGGNPNLFVVYDRRDRHPVMRVDLSRAATGWIYAYDYTDTAKVSRDFRYVNRGVWSPSANPADYNFYVNGAWIAAPQQPVAAAPQPTFQGPIMSPEAKASNEAAAPIMIQQQMQGLITAETRNAEALRR
jgi:hypothetical protein